MTLNEFVSSILQQLKRAKSYEEVDQIVSDSLDYMTKNEFIIKQYLQQIESELDSISPLECDSTQWSSVRYALISLRRIQAANTDNTLVA